jgi:hypothetical protein
MSLKTLFKKKQTWYVIGGVGVLGGLYYAIKSGAGKGLSQGTPTAAPSPGTSPTAGVSPSSQLQALVALATIQSNEKINAERNATTLEAARIAADVRREESQAATARAAIGPAATAAGKLFDALGNAFKEKKTTPGTDSVGRPYLGAPPGGIPPYGPDTSMAAINNGLNGNPEGSVTSNDVLFTEDFSVFPSSILDTDNPAAGSILDTDLVLGAEDWSTYIYQDDNANGGE